MTIRIFVVADTRFHREGLAEGLGSERGCVVVGSAATADAALGASPGAAEADVVVVDVDAAERLVEARTLAGALPGPRIVALGVPETEHDVIACAEAGIAGYVPREASIADLLDTVARVRDGETPCPPHIAAGLFRRLAALSAVRHDEPVAALTRREAEILALIDAGLSNKEIAGRLQIELPTVKNHVHHILEKLGVHRRGEAAARANGRSAL
jgi:two-component system, NarL family, nitrate/nitrite response regulator NarL